MKKYLFLSVIILFGSLIKAQVFDIDTILYNGDLDNHINIVILSDGYIEEELGKFIDDSEDISTALFNEVPYSNYQNYFNVFAIKVPSNESGANHPGTATDVSEPDHPVEIVDNYFGSSFDVANIHRLLVPLNSTAIYTTLATNFPLYDQVIILVNTPYYGGSGGQFATSSLNTSAAEIAIHEMGHSFANLIDEYYAGDQFSGEGINMTAETDPTKVKWKNWMDFEGVGIYQHCCGGDSENWYRPHQQCKMRVLGPAFCSVCVEGTIEVIHDLVPAVVGFQPEEETFTSVDLPLVFKLNITYPIPNSLAIEWTINGDVMLSTVDSLLVFQGDLSEGTNDIFVTVEDQSDLLRIDGHDGIHLEFVLWEIKNDVTGITEFNAENSNIKIDILPNPAHDYFIIKCISETDKKINATLYDVIGNKIIGSEVNSNGTTTMDISDLVSGVYFVQFKIGNNLIGSSKLIKE